MYLSVHYVIIIAKGQRPLQVYELYIHFFKGVIDKCLQILYIKHRLLSQLSVLETQMLQFEFALSFFRTAACKFTVSSNLNSIRSIKDIEKSAVRNCNLKLLL